MTEESGYMKFPFKLKTLKDFEIDEKALRTDEGKCMECNFNPNELKQEAIKWVIHGAKYRRNMFKMFMEFFNITEEDLK